MMEEVPKYRTLSAEEICQALAVVLQYQDVRLQSTPSGPLSDAYRCLLTAIERQTKQTIGLLLDKALGQHTRNAALQLLNALAMGSCNLQPSDGAPLDENFTTYVQILQVLQTTLVDKGADSKRQLMAVLAIQGLLNSLLNLTHGGKALLQDLGVKERFQVLHTFAQMIQPLVGLMQEKSAMQLGKRQPTKLTVSASDLLLLILFHIAEYGLSSDVITDDTQQAAALLWEQNEWLERYLQLIWEWNLMHRELLSITAQTLLLKFRQVKDFKHKVDYQQYCNPSNQLPQASSDHVMCHFWVSYAPLLVEDQSNSSVTNRSKVTAIQKARHFQDVVSAADSVAGQLADLVTELEVPSDSHIGTQTEMAFHSLASICLVLGRMGNKMGKFLDANNTLSQMLCDAVMQRAFQYKDGLVQQLAAQTMTHVLNASSAWNGDVEHFLQLLDERDGASKAAIALVARYAALHPQTVLPQVFRRLQAECRNIRSNALEAIEATFLAACTTVTTEAGHDDSTNLANALLAAHPSLLHTLADLLLERLAEEELALRIQTAGLFQYLAPQLVIPQLVGTLWHKDTKRRSAAHSALKAVLNSNKANLAHILELLNTLSSDKQGIQKAPRTPADIAQLCTTPSPQSNQPDAERVGVVFKYIAEWSETVPVACWDKLVSQCLSLVLEDPTHMYKVRLLATLAPHFVDHQELVLRRITAVVGHWPDVGTAPSSENTVFERLAPLLVLRALPLSMFKSPTSSKADETDELLGTLFNSLWQRAFNAGELLDICKVCMELCARFKPDDFFLKVLQELRATFSVFPASAAQILKIKLCLYGICNALAYLGSFHVGLESEVAALGQYCEEYTALLLDQCLAKYAFEGDEEEKLCIGCLECLAQTITARDLPRYLEAGVQGMHGETAAPKIQVLEGTNNTEPQDAQNTFSCLHTLLSRLEASDTSLHHYIIAVLQSAVKLNSGSPTLLSALANQIVKMLVLKANQYTAQKYWPLAAACLHVLFMLVYSLNQAVHPFVPQLGDVALHCIQHRQGQLRLGGLKLLGALMSAREDFFNSFGPSFLVEVCQQLTSIAMMDSDPAAQQLASGLLQVLTPVYQS